MPTYKIYTSLNAQEQQSIAKGNTVICDDKLRTFTAGSSDFTMIMDGEPGPKLEKIYPKAENLSNNGCGPKLDQYIQRPTMVLSAYAKSNDKPLPVGKRGKVSKASKAFGISYPFVIFPQDYLNAKTIKLRPESEEIEKEAYRRLSSFDALKHTLDISGRQALRSVDLTNPDVQSALQYVYHDKQVAVPEYMDDAFKEAPKFSVILQNLKNNGQITTVIGIVDFCSECQQTFSDLQAINPEISTQALMGKAVQTVATKWGEKCQAAYNPDAKLFTDISQIGGAIARDAMTNYSTVVIITPAIIPETELENPELD